MNLTRKLAIGVGGMLGVVGVAGGVAFAQSSPSSAASTPATHAPDLTQPTASGAATETQGTGAETPGVEEPGDAGLPGGGHADTAGQNVDHQFEGVE